MTDLKDRKEIATKVCDFVTEQKGMDTVLLDVSGNCSFADFFVISTVSSMGHLRGVVHELWGFLADQGLEVADRHKSPDADGWLLIDCGDIIIHLMSQEMRDFYNLEKLWSQSDRQIESFEAPEISDEE
ncbi:MAG: ribosome silencing factor [Sphaerochaetaceae bacterium]|nr:ribosome silencing factor [Sphaerochaetaceae bacterium]